MIKNSKKRAMFLIISILTVATLLLLGATYAYYQTRIIGNESTEQSVNVQSKKAEITYEDGSAVLSTQGLIEPGFTASKTFYVKNTGDQSVTYSIILEDMNNTFERNQDWQVTLTKNGTNVISADDNVHLAVGTHQILVGNETISETNGTTNTYVLTVTYVNSDENQSIDMGQTLSFKVNITEEQYTWNTAPVGSLLYAIKNNVNNIDSNITTKLVSSSELDGKTYTIPGQEASREDEALLVNAEDDYGESYYFRGNVLNNYVNYSGMCWRIVRVQGDGTIKLVLADENGECNASSYSLNNKGSAFINNHSHYIYSYHPQRARIDGSDRINYAESEIRTELTTWKNKTVSNSDGTIIRNANLDISKLIETDFCDDTSLNELKYWRWSEDNYNIIYVNELTNDDLELTSEWYEHYVYNSAIREKNPTLKCNMKGLKNTKATRYKDNIALLTMDEVVLAGAGNNNSKHYLISNANLTTENEFGYTLENYYWTMTSLQNYAEVGEPDVFIMTSSGNLHVWTNQPHTTDYSFFIRPVIVLRNDVLISYSQTSQYAAGTYQNPYVVI